MAAVGEPSAQTILLVRAVEETDVDGALLAPQERRDATRRAFTVTGASRDDRAFAVEAVLRRAQVLLDRLMRRVPSLADVLVVARALHHPGPLFALLGFVAGLATNALGPERRIDLLAFPLLGVCAWNLGVYAVAAIAAVVRLRRAGRGTDARWRHRVGLLTRVSIAVSGWRIRGVVRRGRGLRGTRDRALVEALARFGELWQPVAAPLLVARLRRTLHGAAIAVAAGTVLGMYLRGVAVAYTATWESTFLGPRFVQGLLDTVLGPAAALAGVAVPDVGPEGGAQDAAPWIHLYALTAVLLVALPRAALYVAAALRSRRLSHNVPLDLGEAYFRRILSEWRGDAWRVRVLPYSHRPALAATERLKALLHDCFGGRSTIALLDPVPYGEVALEAALEALAPGEGETCTVALFTAAQSPEVEVHGEFLERLRGRLDPDRDRLLALVDLSTYRGAADRERLEERLVAWRRVIGDAGLEGVGVDLEAPSFAEAARSICDAVSPPLEPAGAS